MAFQRVPLDDDDAQPAPQPRGSHLRLVHSADPTLGDATHDAVADLRDAPARGVMWGLAIALVGFWVPVIALVARLLSR